MRTRRWLALGVWASSVGGYVGDSRSRELSSLEAAEQLRGILADHWWGPAIFIAVYTVRPLVLFPASVLTILGGLAFGPVWGTLWTVIATSLSTAITYAAGRFFGSDLQAERLSRALGRTIDRARRRPFETTLLLRLLYVPFDAVGYVAGYVGLRFVPFALGSALGTVPGTIAFVGFGASIQSLDEGSPGFDLRVLVASVALAVAGSLLARWLQRRERRRPTSIESTPVEG